MLSPAQHALVCEIFERLLPGAEVWVFGSRASGRARPFSDLDLLISKPEQLDWTQRAALRDAFEASSLPFLVDVVEAAELSKSVAERVQAERIALTPRSS